MAERMYRGNLQTDCQGKVMIESDFALVSERSLCTQPDTPSVVANCEVRSSGKWALLSPCQHLKSDVTDHEASEHTVSRWEITAGWEWTE